MIDYSKLEEFADDKFKFYKSDSSPNSQKTLLEKEKLLIMSNFSVCYSGFERLVL